LGDEIFPAGGFFAGTGGRQGPFEEIGGAVVDILFIEIEGFFFLQGGLQAGRELWVAVEDLDEAGGSYIIVFGEIGADFPEQGVIAAGRGQVEYFFQFRLFFLGADDTVVASGVGVIVAADGDGVAVALLRGKGPVDELEGNKAES
jgi:hypothetical protein